MEKIKIYATLSTLRNYYMNPIYCVLISICILSMLTMVLMAKANTTLSPKAKFWFIITFLGIAFGMCAEFTRGFLEVYPISNTFYKIITLLEFIITPMLPIPLSMACGIKKTVVPVSILMGLHGLLELLLLNTGLIFSVSGNSVYHRGPFYIIYIISYIISLIYLIIVYFFISKRFRNRNSFVLVASLIVIFTGIIPSLLDRNVKTAFLGMSFMAVILYGYYNELTQQDLSDEIEFQHEKIKTMQSKTIIGIANLIESRDNNTGTHVKNTSNYVSMLAKAAQNAGVYPEIITDGFVNLVENAAPLHDIGKIAIPDCILCKPDKLTPEEFEQIKIHSTEGGKMILKVLEETTDEKYINLAYDVATNHHEKWDGTGYPEGLVGEAIPVSARIMAIADVYDALTMERVYKKPFPVKKALEIISNDAGKHFDPILAPLFVDIMHSIWV